MNPDSFEDEDSTRLRQRIWGAVVLFAIGIIVLPLLLDGAGSESQFRRVESLREAPERIPQNTPVVAEMRSADGNRNAPDLSQDRSTEDHAAEAMQAERELRQGLQQSRQSSLKAWVVQVGRFRVESDAIDLRDRLRQAGYASFVRDQDSPTDLFHVLVGPMIKQARAEDISKLVDRLLDTESIVLSYP